MGEGWENLISRATYGIIYNVQFSTKSYRPCKESIKHGSNRGGKMTIETFPEEAQMLDLLEREFKPAILNMFI